VRDIYYIRLDPANDIFTELPDHVKYDFLKALYKDLITENSFFNKFDKEFAIRMVPLMKPVLFSAGEYIWEEGEFSSNIILLVEGNSSFFIQNTLDDQEGQETKFSRHSNTGGGENKTRSNPFKYFNANNPKENKIIIFKTMGPGSFFGEVDILLKRRRTCSVIARSKCDAFSLKRKEFENIIQREFPNIYKQFLHLAKLKAVNDIDMKNKCLDTVSKVEGKKDYHLMKRYEDEEKQVDRTTLRSLMALITDSREVNPLEEVMVRNKVLIERDFSLLYRELEFELNDGEMGIIRDLYRIYKG